ncbi:aspartyl-phosphate phosphatase Spo0E family protein [Peribacillus saganii]|uniref:Aspartyl-phosphate phosphatase Spo0E family protein n=1 Tax=Peribacillus saganii TaxID=2303992 RepID=A0A372LQ84_9BACI|nr:aspartyl-phosphate phosphatase Spo0E family protein [Peribacillus saganii]RFU70371.1 aspartyl-phosphate phosphatase Spo0E family protein [Peribacillus saganii]
MLKQELLELIEEKRVELFQVVLKNGLSSHITVEHSQELDRLLNLYNTKFLKADVT